MFVCKLQLVTRTVYIYPCVDRVQVQGRQIFCLFTPLDMNQLEQSYC